MMTQPTVPAFHRRSRLAVIRDLLVIGLCALVVGGFLLDVAGGWRGSRPAEARTATLTS